MQIPTNYIPEKNNVADTTMLSEHLKKVTQAHAMEELYVDGDYYGADVMDKAQNKEVRPHFTDMTGRTPSKKIS